MLYAVEHLSLAKYLVFESPNTARLYDLVKSRLLNCEIDNYHEVYMDSFAWMLTFVGQKLMRNFKRVSPCARNLETEKRMKEKLKIGVTAKLLFQYFFFVDTIVGKKYNDFWGIQLELLGNKRGPELRNHLMFIETLNTQVKEEVFDQLLKSRKMYLELGLLHATNVFKILKDFNVSNATNKKELCKLLAEPPKKSGEINNIYVLHFSLLTVLLVALIFYFKAIFTDPLARSSR